jgi:hypothetical protein
MQCETFSHSIIEEYLNSVSVPMLVGALTLCRQLAPKPVAGNERTNMNSTTEFQLAIDFLNFVPTC